MAELPIIAGILIVSFLTMSHFACGFQPYGYQPSYRKDKSDNNVTSDTEPQRWSDETFNAIMSDLKSDAQLGCVELRSKRYFSDGYCTSIRPITEVVCSGICLPVRYLTWYHLFLKQVPRKKDIEWRCIEDGVRRKRVRLVCRNGERRKYKIKVVTSCKCVRRKRGRNKKSLKNEKQ